MLEIINHKNLIINQLVSLIVYHYYIIFFTQLHADSKQQHKDTNNHRTWMAEKVNSSLDRN